MSKLESAMFPTVGLRSCNCGADHSCGKIMAWIDPGEHVLVNLNEFHSRALKKFLLKDFPVDIQISDRNLRLTAVITYHPGGPLGHYIAYCRRVHGFWEQYNDLLRNVQSVQDSIAVIPYLAVYILHKFLLCVIIRDYPVFMLFNNFV